MLSPILVFQACFWGHVQDTCPSCGLLILCQIRQNTSAAAGACVGLTETFTSTYFPQEQPEDVAVLEYCLRSTNAYLRSFCVLTKKTDASSVRYSSPYLYGTLFKMEVGPGARGLLP